MPNQGIHQSKLVIPGTVRAADNQQNDDKTKDTPKNTCRIEEHPADGFGFRLSRTEGSHHIFVHPDIPELVNLQDVKGQAKPYQIRQFLKLVERYSLKLKEE
jgi:predicted RNA binding protein YcfA (HicA-like mRNA interferase family)